LIILKMPKMRLPVGGSGDVGDGACQRSCGFDFESVIDEFDVGNGIRVSTGD
jgi:hypothetical protein